MAFHAHSLSRFRKTFSSHISASCRSPTWARVSQLERFGGFRIDEWPAKVRATGSKVRFARHSTATREFGVLHEA